MNKQLQKVLNSGIWGTVGPKSESAAAMLAKRLSADFGLLVHSASAALEVQLRALEIAYGDEVIVASYSNPINAMAAANVGASVVFADIDKQNLALSPAFAKAVLTSKTKAIIVDALCSDLSYMQKLAAFCDKNDVKVILNLGDAFDARPMIPYAYTTVIDLSDGCIISAGEGAALIHNNKNAFESAFAIHNCGRPPGAEASINMDAILGGNYRITEWQAAAVEAGIEQLDELMAARKQKANAVTEELTSDFLVPVASLPAVIIKYDKSKNGGVHIEVMVDKLRSKGYNACRPWLAMHAQPFFSSDYYRKMTGCDRSYDKYDMKNSIAAENELIWIKLN